MKYAKLDNSPLKLDCFVNGSKVSFEIDTGSYLSTISKSVLNSLQNVVVVPTHKRAKGYGNSFINFEGETELILHYNGKEVIHSFLIVNHPVSLIGRDLCAKLGIDVVFPQIKKK